jgi:hypothetical protein
VTLFAWKPFIEKGFPKISKFIAFLRVLTGRVEFLIEPPGIDN